MRAPLLLIVTLGCFAAGCVQSTSVSAMFPESAASIEELRKSDPWPTSVEEVSDGKGQVLFAHSDPFGGGRIYVFYAIYVQKNGRWERFAEGMLDSADDARLSIRGGIAVVEARYPGARAVWEKRLSIDLHR